jgi:hypothetical protein
MIKVASVERLDKANQTIPASGANTDLVVWHYQLPSIPEHEEKRGQVRDGLEFRPWSALMLARGFSLLIRAKRGSSTCLILVSLILDGKRSLR